MKKVFLKLLAIALVAAFARTAYQARAVTSSIEIAQAPSAIANPMIPLALPATVNLVLKNNSLMTGQLTAFDSKGQTLQISRSGESRIVQIAQIQQLKFKRDALVYDGTGMLVIRGDDPAMAKQSTWQNIPLQAFKLKDPKLGQAQVTLAGVLKPIQLRGIRAVAAKSLYVVDEIQFQPVSKMTIRVTPRDRPF